MSDRNHDWIVDVLVELHGYCDAKGMSVAADRLVKTISDIKPYIGQKTGASNIIHLAPRPRREVLNG